MPPRTKAREESTRPPISITAVLDAVGALASGSVHGHLYLYDTNKAGGSTGLGGEELRTRVRAGDRLLWNCLALECEAFVGIAGIDIDRSVCEPERQVYPGTDVAYWIATVKRDDIDVVPYKINFLVGTRTEPIPTTVSPTLVG